MSKELKLLESMKDSLTTNGDIFEYTKEYNHLTTKIRHIISKTLKLITTIYKITIPLHLYWVSVSTI